MKKIKLTFTLTVFMSIFCTDVFAYDISVENEDGIAIYYNYINDGKELEVTNRSGYGYSGVETLNIPQTVTYMNRIRKVTKIGDYALGSNIGKLAHVTIPNTVIEIGVRAFSSSGLVSVTIPNSVTTIGDEAFSYCSSLESITLGNGIKNVGYGVFDNCKILKKVIVDDISVMCNNYMGFRDFLLYKDEETEIKELVIPKGVTNIIGWAFSSCKNEMSVIIGNDVETVGASFAYSPNIKSVFLGDKVRELDKSFDGCTGLESVSFGSSIRGIGGTCFRDCKNLNKVIIRDVAAWCSAEVYDSPILYAHRIYSDENSEITDLVIPEGVEEIKYWNFAHCSELKTVKLPSSLKIIGSGSFYKCNGLTSLTIPANVQKIEWSSALDCDNLVTVISKIQEPFEIESTFSKNTLMNGTLFVPDGTIDKYKSTKGWKDFMFIEDSSGAPSEPETPTCATPTISYKNGKLTFSCETEGASCHSRITDEDIATYTTNDVQLSVTYNISVYAVKNGYYNSETATATLCWIDQQPKTDGITNGVANVSAKALLIQCNGGTINVQGADDGEVVSVYNIKGIQAGTAVSQNGNAKVVTSLQSGNIAVVKIGKKSVKVVMK